MSITAVIDLDSIKYAAASKGEVRTIRATHSSGDVEEHTNRTDLKKSLKGTTRLYEEYTIEDVQEYAPIEHAISSAKKMVENALNGLGTKKYKAYVGKGDSFRVERSTLLKYKGNRDNNIRPLRLDDVSEFLTKRYKAEIVSHYEVDDICVMEGTSNSNYIVVGKDKDFYGFPINFYNFSRPDEGVINCRGFGKLWRNDKGKVRGYGRLHHYWQILGQDSADNYKANCFSSKKWGDVNSFNSLVDTKSDKESFLAMKESFKLLYPEKKIITGWRGDTIEIDWFYVMKECFDLSRLLRHENDVVELEAVFEKLGISYE